MRPPSQRPTLAAANGAIYILRELINYVSFMFRVPVAICFFAMIVVVAIVLQDVYPGIGRVVLPPLLIWFPGQMHLEMADFVKGYAIASTALYLLAVVVRLALRGRTWRVSYRVPFGIAAAFATLGWGFILVNVQYMRVAAGTSRAGIALVFACFYLLTLAAFAIALAVSRFADFIAQAAGDAVERYFGVRPLTPPVDSRPAVP